VGWLMGQKTGWARSAVGPISELKTKINNMKPVGLPGVLGLNQFGLRRRMKKSFQNFSKGFIYFYLNQRVFKYFQIKILNWISKCNKIKLNFGNFSNLEIWNFI
jgi:hypothetical protein